MSYWDTSALAKLYLVEADSEMFEAKAAEPGAILTSARITMFEFRRVALRKEAAGGLQPGGAEAVWQELASDVAAGWLRIHDPVESLLPEFDAVMTACYRRSPPLPARTLDALHLAVARLAEETEFVTTDKKLREAAAFLGFRLFPV